MERERKREREREREDVELSDCVKRMGGYVERERIYSSQIVSNELGAVWRERKDL